MAEEINIYFGATSLLCALGNKAATLQAMADGKSGLQRHGSAEMYAGLIKETPEKAGFSRFCSLAVNQIEAVLAASGLCLSNPDTQLLLATTKGDVSFLEGINATVLPEAAFLPYTASRLEEHFHCAHSPVIISNACISGVSAFIVGRELLREGTVRHIVIVGCDVLSEFITAGFASFKTIGTSPCRPYDASRDGLTLGEACGCVLLTVDEKRAEKPLIRLAGGAVTNDANHISGPSRTGDGLYLAIDAALREAGIEPSHVGFVNAHGTATLYNDEMESKAIALAGLAETPLNGLKGYIGHTLGASGVVETIICLEELRRGYIFGTAGFRELGTSVPLRVSAEKQTATDPCCVKTASGFGGCNAAIVLDAGKQSRRNLSLSQRAVQVVAEYILPSSDLPFERFIRMEFKNLNAPNIKFYKMSALCKAVYVAAERLLDSFDLSPYAPARRAVILANATSSLETDAEHQQVLDRHLPEGASPAVFVYTLPNLAAGELCIRHRFQGDNTFFVEKTDSGLAERYARWLIAGDKADVAICGWCDKLGEQWNIHLKLLKS